MSLGPPEWTGGKSIRLSNSQRSGSSPGWGIWQMEATRRSASQIIRLSGAMNVAGAKGAALQITEPVLEEMMSADEMIACLGSCRTRSEIAAMIEALSLHPWLNTPAETKRLEAARAAMGDWKSYSHACQARHNAHRLGLSHALNRIEEQSARRLASSPSRWVTSC